METIWTSSDQGPPLAPETGGPGARRPLSISTKRNRFWWFVAFSLVLTGGIALGFAILFWRGLAPLDQQSLMRIAGENAGYLFGGLILLLAAVFAGLDGMFNIYILPLVRLIEEFAILINVNPAHRVQLEGGRDIIRLANMINAGADRVEALQHGIDDRIRQVRAEAEAEKQMLAAVLAELPQGVLLCNAEGQILLYNRLARLYLAGAEKPPSEDASSECYLGLGRSIFRLVGQACLDEAVEEMTERLDRHPHGDVGAGFILQGAGGRRLYAQTAPILYDDGRYGGFILLLKDIEAQIGFEQRCIGQWRRWRQRTADLLRGLNRDGEEIRDSQALKRRLIDELSALSETLDEPPPLAAAGLWPLEPTPAGAFLGGLRHRAGQLFAADLNMDAASATVNLELDVALMRDTLVCLMARLHEQIGMPAMGLNFMARRRWACLDLVWSGPPVGEQWLRHQLGQAVQSEERFLPLTIRQVLDHHRIAIQRRESPPGSPTAGLRLEFPVFDDAAVFETEMRGAAIIALSRPEFYDFDLFDQPGLSTDQGSRPLGELTYTVFDTETTGLDPVHDEIVSIGAVRIVNGRVLREECFDQLVDPRRPMPAEAVRIHGIGPERLIGQPTIERVLPAFQRFAEDTILVGHNAAFDMRMFQVKEALTGVRLIQPVLDTILLSSVVNPNLKDHDLDAIALRLLGRRIVERHSALGDALATAEVFLKLLALLAEMGVTTLDQALAASRKTYYARLKY